MTKLKLINGISFLFQVSLITPNSKAHSNIEKKRKRTPTCDGYIQPNETASCLINFNYLLLFFVTFPLVSRDIPRLYIIETSKWFARDARLLMLRRENSALPQISPRCDVASLRGGAAVGKNFAEKFEKFSARAVGGKERKIAMKYLIIN